MTQEEEDRELQRYYESGGGMMRENDDEEGGALDTSNNDFGINMVGGLRIKELDQSQELNRRYFGDIGEEDDDEDEDHELGRRGGVEVRDVKLEFNNRSSKIRAD